MTLPKPPQRITTGFAFSYVDRAIREGIADREFGKQQIAEVIAYFGEPLCCVYCGSEEVQRWDHLVPVNRGGDTVLGNMVPACSLCDDSKQDHSFDEWMTSDAHFSPKSRGVRDIGLRIQRLRIYAAHFRYKARSLDARCDTRELQKLTDLRTKIESLRTEIEQFIREHTDKV
jgi:hypothetical protein